MIGYFPAAYPDELFYSICARFSDRMQYPKKGSPMQELFGKKTMEASLDLPSHLETFIKGLPPRHHYTIDRFIDSHTLFPFYRPFLKLDSQQRVRECMYKDGAGIIHALLGSTINNLYLGCLRFCPQCVEADRQVFEECYWHRVHQLSCVRICPTHGIPLLESGTRVSNREYKHEFISAEKAIRENCALLSTPEASYKTFLRIARDVSWLLEHPQFIYDSDLLKTQYHTILFDQGLTSYGKRVYMENFLQRFNGYYTQDFLQLTHCELEGRTRDCWPLRAVRPGGTGTHPLHHLLLIHFLGYEAETFFSLSIKRNPFGDGPWPCLNPASDHYKQYRVLDCQQCQHLDSYRGKPTGLFSCECGFVYVRKGPDTTPDDHFRLGRVKVYGHVWETTLRQLWDDSTISLNEIARRFQSSPITIARQASRLGLPFPRPRGKKREWKLEYGYVRRDTPRIRHSREECRQSWLLLMEKMPEAGRRVLQKSLPGIYAWLAKNDREWLKAHTPISPSRHPPGPQIDWESKDREIVEAVKVSAHRLKHTDGYPARLTLTAIGRDIGHQRTLYHHLDKLPLTKQVLSEVLETPEDFAIRRILWSASHYQEENILPTRKQLAHRVHVFRNLAELPRVKEAIDTAWASLSSMRDGNHG